MRRVPSVLLVLAFALLGMPLAASAHDVIESTDPQDGSTVAQLPQQVSLRFSEPPLSIGTQVVVTGPSGPVQQGTPTVAGNVVSQAISTSAPAGDYTVSYRVASDDGHPVTGAFAFHATTGLDGSTATAPSTLQAAETAADAEDASSFPLVAVLLTVAGTIVLIAIGGFVALRSREADRR